MLRPVLVLVVIVGLAGCGEADSLAERRADVAERGARIMPFDLEATTHTFTDTADGGVQRVVADEPDDAEQIRRIRAHLREERDRFARGDYDDPAAIHGHDMEGLAELRNGYRAITVTYADLPDGGRLTYTATEPHLVDAIHAWFARQVMDHGAHAEAG